MTNTSIFSGFKQSEKRLDNDAPNADAIDADAGPAWLDARTHAENRSHAVAQKRANDEKPQEIGGPQGLEPTRYGDWEKAGRCFDF